MLLRQSSPTSQIFRRTQGHSSGNAGGHARSGWIHAGVEVALCTCRWREIGTYRKGTQEFVDRCPHMGKVPLSRRSARIYPVVMFVARSKEGGKNPATGKLERRMFYVPAPEDTDLNADLGPLLLTQRHQVSSVYADLLSSVREAKCSPGSAS